MEFRAPPPKAQCFTLQAPVNSTIDGIINGFEEVVGPRGLKTLQHQGGYKFFAVAATPAAASKLSEQGSINIGGVETALQCVGPQVVYITILRINPLVADSDLAAALAPYGKVRTIQYQSFKGFPYVETGNRLVKMEMAKPVPNFLHVRGERVQCEYKGVKRVCSRCGQQGHSGADCKTPWCAKCTTFGHDAEECTARCRRCQGCHATADCLRPRTYAAALHDFPALPARTAAATEEDEAAAKEVEQAAQQRADDDASDDGAGSFDIGEASSPLSPFGNSDEESESDGENHPQQRQAAPSSETSSDTPREPATAIAAARLPATMPLPPRGRAAAIRAGKQAAKQPAASEATADHAAAAPPSTATVTTTGHAPQDTHQATDTQPTPMDTSTRMDPTKRGPPTSSDSDSTNEHSKKLCVTDQ